MTDIHWQLQSLDAIAEAGLYCPVVITIRAQTFDDLAHLSDILLGGRAIPGHAWVEQPHTGRYGVWRVDLRREDGADRWEISEPDEAMTRPAIVLYAEGPMTQRRGWPMTWSAILREAEQT